MFASKDVFLTPPSGGYTIGKSVRLRSSASAYLNRTPVSSGSQTTFTWSGWVKRGTLGVAQPLFSSGSAANNALDILFTANDVLQIEEYNVSTNYFNRTTQVFRDPSAWYHIVVAIDSTQATAANRVKIYLNGSQITAFSAAFYPTQNFAYMINTSSYAAKIGLGTQYNTNYYDGYLTEINFIDGQALTPSSFGSTNATTGVWQPAKYTGTYGTNGFYLNFSSNGTSAALGTDFSGNSNTWTVNNVSVTAGATYDSMVDSPTVSAVSSNYPVWNPLVPTGQAAPTDGNLSQINSTGCRTATIPFPQSGKWYLEWLAGSNTMAIVVGLPFVPTTQANSQTYSVGYYNNGNKYIAGTATSYGATFTSGDIIGLALDFTVNPPTITFYKNNSSQGAINLTSGIDYVVAAGIGGTGLEVINFGQRPFTYTPPTGFVALNTYNLPASTITNGAAYMAATTFNGITGGTQTITNTVNGVGFQPDFVWMKLRSGIQDHFLIDSVRGSSNYVSSNTTAAEVTGATAFLTSFNSNGWSLGSGGYGNGVTVVGWNWKAGGTSSSNTNGSITSTVSVGATQGFSVVTYTGTGANATVGHGLGVAPSMIIARGRSAGTAGFNWRVYHGSLAATQYLEINLTSAAQTDATVWNSTAPTSSVFSLGTSGNVNGSTQTYVAYCFAAVKGFSAFGSYTGNNSTDGPFVYLGFRPRFVMFKDATSVSAWMIMDSSRDAYNVEQNGLAPNSSNAESTYSGTPQVDFLSNGFKIRANNAGQYWNNVSGNTYVYAAFAENPFKNALAR